MPYPIDVEAELDRALDKLVDLRISGEKWAYFRQLVEEINAAFLAGVEGAGGYPWDIEANLSADMDRLGGFGVTERRLVIAWMERINAAYREGRMSVQLSADGDGQSLSRFAPEEKIAVGALEFVDPKSGVAVRVVKDPRELEYYLSKYVRDGKPFSFRVPGVKRIATVQIQKERVRK